jgi:hypothetical protein
MTRPRGSGAGPIGPHRGRDDSGRRRGSDDGHRQGLARRELCPRPVRRLESGAGTGHRPERQEGDVTGTKDKDYNIIWFTEVCLSNVLRLETYVQDAEREGDNELAEFFRRAQSESRKGAEQGKQLLASRLGR